MTIISSRNTNWFKAVLRVAGVYHIIWGISVIFFPHFWFNIADLSQPNYIQLWQFIGLHEMIFGIGYFMASYNPLRHWRIIFIGTFTKICVTIGFLYYYLLGQEPAIVFNMVLSNHIFWIIPFGIILYNAYHHQYLIDNEMIGLCSEHNLDLLNLYETDKNENLKSISDSQPTMLIFLRNFGCTFCKETLHIVNSLKSEIESQGTKIIFVHMDNNNTALDALQKCSVQDIDVVSDPECILYKGFNLKRGSITQLFGLKVLYRSVYLWLTKKGYFISQTDTDIFQMPGVFLVYKDKIVKQYIHHSAADIPPYLELAAFSDVK